MNSNTKYLFKFKIELNIFESINLTTTMKIVVAFKKNKEINTLDKF